MASVQCQRSQLTGKLPLQEAIESAARGQASFSRKARVMHEVKPAFPEKLGLCTRSS